ncbi:hypothetical protein K7472_14895 [Streptomyces sp. PTM05]|uniref:Amidotransferase n=1 Tax=Streptantibioticus parmotrematis TaxID=2873249 RepID=A0ABS7QSI4_9ACTN|nr:hypothetical protein [Streptantibioticus parmotrematis]MBY8886138.1 hypothetical protein [Streptantibioticus parmotrematis]
MSKGATLFILLGLFLAGGVYSFWKQKMSKSMITLVAIGSAMSLAAGLMRL